MNILNLLAFIGPTFAVISYITACSSNEENMEISRFPRWTYLLSIPLSFTGFGSMLAYTMVWSPWFIIPIFMVPGFALSLGQIMKVRDNEIQIIQNTWYTRKLDHGSALRLFSRAGLVPLLHGEVFREVLTEETRKRELNIDNVESKDNTPLNVEISFWIRPDFNHIQQILETNQNIDAWWDTVLSSAERLITKRASDLVKRRDASVAVGCKETMSMSLKADFEVDSSDESKRRFFKEENEMGFIIKDMIFADINWTDNVREGQEYIQNAVSLADAAKKLAKELGLDFSNLSEKEKKVFVEMMQIQKGTRDRRDFGFKLDIENSEASKVLDVLPGIKKWLEKITKEGAE